MEKKKLSKEGGEKWNNLSLNAIHLLLRPLYNINNYVYGWMPLITLVYSEFLWQLHTWLQEPKRTHVDAAGVRCISIHTINYIFSVSNAVFIILKENFIILRFLLLLSWKKLRRFFLTRFLNIYEANGTNLIICFCNTTKTGSKKLAALFTAANGIMHCILFGASGKCCATVVSSKLVILKCLPACSGFEATITKRVR